MMGTGAGVCKGLISVVLIAALSACTSAEPAGFSLPTLAVLPSVTPLLETAVPTQTPPPAETSTPLPTATETPACDVPAWWKTASPVFTRFFDTWDAASVTARTALSPLLLELRATGDEFEAMSYPDCIRDLRAELAAAMTETLEGFNLFLAQSDAAGLMLQRAALRFRAAAATLEQYAISPDPRLSSTIDQIGGIPAAATLTWVFLPDDERATAGAATNAARATAMSELITLTPAATEAN